MFRWVFVSVLLSACGIAAVWMLVPRQSPATPPPESPAKAARKSRAAGVQSDKPAPSRPSSASTGTRGQPNVYVYPKNSSARRSDPVIIPDGILVIVDKQEVASEKEGVIKFVGTDVEMGENVPADKQLPEAQLGFLAIFVGHKPIEGEKCFQVPNDPNDARNWYRRWTQKDRLEPEKIFLLRETRNVRKLQIGDWVKRGQLLAQINPAKAFDDVSVKNAKLAAVERQRLAAYKTKNEYERRLVNYREINRKQPGTIPVDTLMETELKHVESEQQEQVKQAEIVEAQCTLNAAVTDLKMHEVRASIDGVIKAIYRNFQGDAVKPYEAIMRIENPSRLRVEARLELQEALKLNQGMTAIVEASRPEAPSLVLTGHLGTVNCVAVSKGKRPVIVSGSDDETLRGWAAGSGEKLWMVNGLHSSVRSVACTPPGCKYNLACFGCSDGTVRLFDLDHTSERPLEMAERHLGPVLGVAFSSDGETIATCGDDRLIRLWKTSTRDLLHTLSKHTGPVTSVQFTPTKRLVSAGKDKRLVVWSVEDLQRPHVLGSPIEDRGGEVPTLGVSPDGKTVLFDKGKEMRLLTLEEKHLVGILSNFSEAAPFSTMALFSPDGKTILTNNHSTPEKSPLQLWRTPVTQARGSELRQFVWKETATCGAFAPEADAAFAVTGTENNKVLVWNMPSKEEIDSRLEARVTLVEKYLDTQSRDVRVWAELESPEWLFPGMHATMVVRPERK